MARKCGSKNKPKTPPTLHQEAQPSTSQVASSSSQAIPAPTETPQQQLIQQFMFDNNNGQTVTISETSTISELQAALGLILGKTVTTTDLTFDSVRYTIKYHQQHKSSYRKSRAHQKTEHHHTLQTHNTVHHAHVRSAAHKTLDQIRHQNATYEFSFPTIQLSDQLRQNFEEHYAKGISSSAHTCFITDIMSLSPMVKLECYAVSQLPLEYMRQALKPPSILNHSRFNQLLYEYTVPDPRFAGMMVSPNGAEWIGSGADACISHVWIWNKVYIEMLSHQTTWLSELDEVRNVTDTSQDITSTNPKPPAYSIVHFPVGRLPHVFQNASLWECISVARGHFTGHISVIAGGARSLRTHVMSYNHSDGSIVNVLPHLGPNTDTFSFVMASDLTESQKAILSESRVHTCSVKKVKELLEWLVRHNDLYSSRHVSVSLDGLNQLQANANSDNVAGQFSITLDVSDQANAHTLESINQRASDVTDPLNNPDGFDTAGGGINLEFVRLVVADPNGDKVHKLQNALNNSDSESHTDFSDPDTPLTTTLPIHSSSKKVPTVSKALPSAIDQSNPTFQVKHSTTLFPESEPHILEYLFPELFLWGLGGFELENRCFKYTRQDIVRHLLRLSSRRFAQSSRFILWCYDYFSFKLVKGAVFGKVAHNTVLQEKVQNMTASELSQAADHISTCKKRAKMGLPSSTYPNPPATAIIDVITTAQAARWGSDQARKNDALQVKAISSTLGSPNVFFTLTPATHDSVDVSLWALSPGGPIVQVVIVHAIHSLAIV